MKDTQTLWLYLSRFREKREHCDSIFSFDPKTCVCYKTKTSGCYAVEDLGSLFGLFLCLEWVHPPRNWPTLARSFQDKDFKTSRFQTGSFEMCSSSSMRKETLCNRWKTQHPSLRNLKIVPWWRPFARFVASGLGDFIRFHQVSSVMSNTGR